MLCRSVKDVDMDDQEYGMTSVRAAVGHFCMENGRWEIKQFIKESQMTGRE